MALFLEGDVGERIMGCVQSTMTVQERRIEAAKSHLSALGFPLVDLGGDPTILSVSDALSRWESDREIHSGDIRSRLYDAFKRTASLQRIGARLFEGWVRQKEGAREPVNHDAHLRLCWATLCRHSGRPESALLATEVIELPFEKFPLRGAIVAELCTVRAATLMDLAEQRQSSREELLVKARAAMNKARANTEGDSEYLRNAYMRLKKLELDSDHS